jgi:hypothetical protein
MGHRLAMRVGMRAIHAVLPPARRTVLAGRSDRRPLITVRVTLRPKSGGAEHTHRQNLLLSSAKAAQMRPLDPTTEGWSIDRQTVESRTDKRR